MNINRIASLAAVLALGLVLGGGASYLWSSKGETSSHVGEASGQHHDDHDDDFERGRHGGRLLSEDGLELEITIYERGIPPQFRVYASNDGKPISLDAIDLTIRLHRLGGRTDQISFQPESEYLRGDKVVEEPHSFDVEVAAEWEGKHFEWQYAQYETRVILSPEAVQYAGIEVSVAASGRIAQTLALRGEILLNGDEVAHLVPRVAGIVKRVDKRLGDTVKLGEVMAVLESRQLATAKSAYLAETQRLDLAQKTFASAEELVAKGILPTLDFLTIRKDRDEAKIKVRTARHKLHALGVATEEIEEISEEGDEEFSTYKLRAPFAGTVVEKHITLGELVDEDSNVYLLANLGTVWADLTVYQKDASKIRPGQPVVVSFRGEIPDAEGVIDSIMPVVDKTTRTATARVVLDNKHGQLRPGLFVTAEVVEHEAVAPIVVTREAVQNIRGWTAVFVRYGNTFEARPLELGHRDGQWVEVLSGLSAGEHYVAKNSFVLKAEIGKSGATHGH